MRLGLLESVTQLNSHALELRLPFLSLPIAILLIGGALFLSKIIFLRNAIRFKPYLVITIRHSEANWRAQ